MEILSYITENALILIPVLLIVGRILKGIEKIPDKWIPLILLPLGVVGAMALGGCAVGAVAAGYCAVGSLAVGKIAVGSLAVGGEAFGALTLGRKF